MNASRSATTKKKRGYMAALVVGTALTAFGGSATPASADQHTVAELTRYCNACWRNARVQPDDWSDCTQEVFERLLERVRTDRWNQLLTQETEDRREFLRAIDTVKKRNQRAHRPASLAVEVKDFRLPESGGRDDIRRTVLQAAERCLNARQSEIIARSLDGWSVSEIANQLGTSPMRVSDEKYKAIRRLRETLA